MLEEIKAQLGTCTVVTKEPDLQSFKPTRIIALDIETYGCDGKPGDSPHYSKHGILGVSVCNSLGDAVYIVVNDQKNYDGVPIKSVISWLNNSILLEAEVVVTHHGKFDLGFLLKRGMSLPVFSNLRWMDTWLLANLRNEGMFISTRLKDLMKSIFQIEVRSETLKDKYFEEHKTKDYGDLPVELLAPYACDDVRYTMMLLLGQPPLSPREMENHDLYTRNWLHLIVAERKGVALNIEKMRGRAQKCLTEMQIRETEIKGFLGATQLDINDAQAMMQYLHQQNLHPAPRQQFGETVFVFDHAFLVNTGAPIAVTYAFYFSFKQYLTEFSARHGRMAPRAWATPETEEGGVHPGFHASIYSRGGLIEMKDPNVTYNGVPLDASVRAGFIPRKNHRFIVLAALQLKETLLAYYCQDKELLDRLRTEVFHEIMAERAGVDPLAAREVCRGILEGSGKGLLELRLKLAGIKAPGTRGHFELSDRIEAALPGLKEFKKGIEARFNAGQTLSDVRQRTMKIDKDKLYRQHAVLIASSFGSVLATYLDCYCRLGVSVGAHPVIVHENEFVFEVHKDQSENAYAAMLEMSKTPLLPCALPSWYVAEDTFWRSPLP